MNPSPIDLSQDFVVVGIAVRTSPERAGIDIPAAWQRFMSDDAKPPPGAKNDGYAYAVYCDYESDHGGSYTMVLGVEVEPTAPVPPGMRRVRVPFGKYVSFAAKGDPREVVWNTWVHVNTQWDGRERRRYIADYERYALGAMTATSVDALVVVGVV